MLKSIDLEGLKDEVGQEICFMHGYCHYLALGMADEYNTKIALWVDFDEYIGKEVLVHAFSVIGESLYFDAEGVFTDLRERVNEFDFNYEPNLVIVSKDEAKKIFRKMKISYGDTKLKRFVREKLRNHSIVVQLRLKSDGLLRLFAYKGEGRVAGRDVVMIVQVDSTGRLSKHINTLTLNEFKSAQKMFCGVIENKG